MLTLLPTRGWGGSWFSFRGDFEEKGGSILEEGLDWRGRATSDVEGFLGQGRELLLPRATAPTPHPKKKASMTSKSM